MTARSVILQEPLDVIELDLGPRRIAETAAQFLQDAAHPLHVDFARDHLRQLVADIVGAQRTPERIGAVGAGLLAAHALARTIALPFAVALLHCLGKALRALAQRIERLALRLHRGVGIALAQPAAGITHRAVGLAKAVVAVALVALLALLALALLALLSLLALPALALLALLALLSHTALGQFLLQLLQAVAQPLLILLQVAHVLIAALLLAAHAIAPRILALLERLVTQL